MRQPRSINHRPMWRGMSLSVHRSCRYPERPSAFGVREVCGRTLRAKEGDLRAAGRDKPLARRTPNKMRVPGVAAPRKSANRRRRDHSMLAMSVVPARFRLLPVVSTPAVALALAPPGRSVAVSSRLTAERQLRVAVMHRARWVGSAYTPPRSERQAQQW